MDQSNGLVFDDRHLLPEGVHLAFLEEIGKQFGRFQKSDTRIRLFERLEAYVEEVKKAGWDVAIIIDGSFVMSNVDEPRDIDIILVLPDGWDSAAEVRPFEYNLISRKRVKREYQFDLFAVRKGSGEEAKMLEFFGRVKLEWCQRFDLPAGSRKGIVRVAL